MIDVVRAADISGRDLTDYHDSRMVAQLEMELSVMREGFIIKLDLVEKYRHDCKRYIKHMDLMEAKQVEMAGLIADLESSLQIEKEMSDSLHSQVYELNATISDEVMVRVNATRAYTKLQIQYKKLHDLHEVALESIEKSNVPKLKKHEMNNHSLGLLFNPHSLEASK